MFEGIEVKFGENTYIIPPLSLGQLRGAARELLKKHDELVLANDLFGSMELRGKLIHLALTRNYPDLDQEIVFNYLDMGNLDRLWAAVLGASGLKPGEATAAETTK